MKIALIFVLLLLSACSSRTQLHVYAKYLTKEQTSSVVKQIDHTMFNITLNQLAFPTNIIGNAIVYSPSPNSRTRLTKLMRTLSNLGFNITNASLISENNHSFTANNVGVFLLPNGVNAEPKSDNINTYQFLKWSSKVGHSFRAN